MKIDPLAIHEQKAALSAMIELTNLVHSKVIITAGKTMLFTTIIIATSVPDAAPILLHSALEEKYK